MLAQPHQIQELQQEIQKLRIAAAIYREIDGNFADPGLYKEMNLLNRMMVGRDLETEAEKRKSASEQTAASERLRDTYGLEPDSAQRIARVIAATIGRKMEDDGLDGEEPESEPLGPTRVQ